MNIPKISVITTSYNYEQYIGAAIDSVLNQTFKDFEYIIIDDGSKDNSLEIINEYARNDSRIKILTHQSNENKGLIESLKYAVNAASGEYIAFLESDDIWCDNHLEKKIELLKSHPDSTIIFNDTELFGDEDRIADMKKNFQKRDKLFSEKRLSLSDMFYWNIIATFSCVMIRRDCLLNLDFDAPVPPCLDWYLWMQLVKQDKEIIFLPQHLTKWRLHKSSYVKAVGKSSNGRTFNMLFDLFNTKNNVLTFTMRLINNSFLEKLLRPQVRQATRKLFNFTGQNKIINFKTINPDIEHNCRTAVFSHWDKDGLVDDYVLFYLKELKKCAKNIVFVSDCDLTEDEKVKVKAVTPHIIANKHGEYDFGSYKRGFFYAKENNLLCDTEELILCNDSCYGPLKPFESVFSEMSNKICDFWGITENIKGIAGPQDNYKAITSPHLQSYFVVLRKNVFNCEQFIDFMNSIGPQEDKKAIIYNYEIGLSRLLSGSFKYLPYIKPEHEYDYTVNSASDLVKKGSPLIKTNILRRKFIMPSSFTFRKTLKKYTNYPIELIENNLKRTQEPVTYEKLKFCMRLLKRKYITQGKKICHKTAVIPAKAGTPDRVGH